MNKSERLQREVERLDALLDAIRHEHSHLEKAIQKVRENMMLSQRYETRQAIEANILQF